MFHSVKELIDEEDTWWRKATSHIFTRELCDGTLDLEKLYVYLNQDSLYFWVFFKLMGKLILQCPESKAALRLGKQVGFISNDENTYFEDCLKFLEKELKYGTELKSDNIYLDEVKEYLNYLEKLSENHVSYGEVITAIYVMEQVYLTWSIAGLENKPQDLPWWFNDWIKLHSGEMFEEWCGFLEGQVNKCISESDEEQLGKIKSVFTTIVKLEFGFFDSCYNNGLHVLLQRK